MNGYLKERNKWWPVSKKLLASYNDGSHTRNTGTCNLGWYKNNDLHRDGDKPARIWSEGTLEFFKNGQKHRDLDKPAVIRTNGTLEWWRNWQLHRDGDKPSLIDADDRLVWYKHGLPHRASGPAVIHSNNEHEYWIDGKNIDEEVDAWLKTRKYKYPFTPEQQVEFTLTFC